MTSPTDEELDALVQMLQQRNKSKHGYTGHPLYNRDGLQAADAITALRAQLALAVAERDDAVAIAADALASADRAKAALDRAEAELAALSDPLVVDMNMLNGRIAKPCVNGIVHIYEGQLVSVDKLQTELAAQIEADAVLLQAVADNWDCGHNESRNCRCAELAEQWGIAAAEIRAQPHDRTALDRMMADARAKALREAANVVMKKTYRVHAPKDFRDGYDVAKADVATAILALIDK